MPKAVNREEIKPYSNDSAGLNPEAFHNARTRGTLAACLMSYTAGPLVATAMQAYEEELVRTKSDDYWRGCPGLRGRWRGGSETRPRASAGASPVPLRWRSVGLSGSRLRIFIDRSCAEIPLFEATEKALIFAPFGQSTSGV